jgi:hypothetical protein
MEQRKRQPRRPRRQHSKYGERFAEYLEARARAERSREISDGIAAGRAWIRFLQVFGSTNNRERAAA